LDLLPLDDRRRAALLAPVPKFLHRARIGAARVRFADVGDKEFLKARLRAVTGGGDQRRKSVLGKKDELVHGANFREGFLFHSATKSQKFGPCCSGGNGTTDFNQLPSRFHW
jgi:hypothetical protein